MRRMRGSGKKTSLNAVEQYELNQWLEQNEITSTNLRRSFTDVLPLARLLARYYPDLIDLNYYPPRNSVHNKLCNWESFNKRVLTRLGLHLSRDQMVRVARSVPGSVDLLLFNIMRLQLAAERKALEAKGSSSSDNETTALQQQVQQQPSDSQQLLEEVGTEKPATDNTIYDTDNGQSDVNEQPQRPRTLKQAQAALRRSERAQRATGTATLQRRSHNATTGGSSEQPHQRGRQAAAAKKR